MLRTLARGGVFLISARKAWDAVSSRAWLPSGASKIGPRAPEGHQHDPVGACRERMRDGVRDGVRGGGGWTSAGGHPLSRFRNSWGDLGMLLLSDPPRGPWQSLVRSSGEAHTEGPWMPSRAWSLSLCSLPPGTGGAARESDRRRNRAQAGCPVLWDRIRRDGKTGRLRGFSWRLGPRGKRGSHEVGTCGPWGGGPCGVPSGKSCRKLGLA